MLSARPTGFIINLMRGRNVFLYQGVGDMPVYVG